MNDQTPPERPAPGAASARPSLAWPIALVLVALFTIGASLLAVWLVLRSGERTGAAVLNTGVKAARELERIVAAFRTGTVRTEFTSYATTVTGETRLQFASLDQSEVFRREEGASLLWGQVPLPTVIVEATVPVQYTYFVDLEGDWRFELESDVIEVIAPAIGFNRPAIDPSAIRFEVRQDSLLRDENIVAENLRSALGPLLRERARDNVDLVREVGRRKIEEFVATWLFRDFGDTTRRYRVEVVFADELEDERPLILRNAEEGR